MVNLQKAISCLITFVVCFIINSDLLAQDFGNAYIKFLIETRYGASLAAERIEFDGFGDLTKLIKPSIEFGMKEPPIMKYEEKEALRWFRFTDKKPGGKTSARIVITTPKNESNEARIPDFVVKISKKTGTLYCFEVNEIIGYITENRFEFYTHYQKFGSSFPTAPAGDWFNRGATHHIEGRVTLFGIEFESDSKSTLVFRIEGDRYLYLEGKGTATLNKEVIRFGNE